MWKSFASAAWLLMVSGPVSAQQAAPKPDSPEAKAAMERAQRMADNPMRVILQAAKIKRKPGEAEAPEPPADPVNLRRTAVRTAAEGAVAPKPAVAQTQAAATQTPVAAPTPAPVPEPAPAKVMQTGLLASSAASSVPSLEIALPVEAAPVTTKAVAPQSIPIAPTSSRPTLVTMVEPAIPARLLADASGVREVIAELSLRADGSVAGVSLVPPVPRAWKGYIQAALEQWRFEPLPEARVHRVQLVFDDAK